MTTLPKSTLEIIGETIAIANNARFVWRKLAERPSVQAIAETETPESIKDALRHLLGQDSLSEDEQTLGCCLIVAIGLKNVSSLYGLTNELGASLDKIGWANRLLRVAPVGRSANTEAVVVSSSRPSDQPASSGTQTTLIVTI